MIFIINVLIIFQNISHNLVNSECCKMSDVIRSAQSVSPVTVFLSGLYRRTTHRIVIANAICNPYIEPTSASLCTTLQKFLFDQSTEVNSLILYTENRITKLLNDMNIMPFHFRTFGRYVTDFIVRMQLFNKKTNCIPKS